MTAVGLLVDPSVAARIGAQKGKVNPLGHVLFFPLWTNTSVPYVSSPTWVEVGITSEVRLISTPGSQ